MKANFIYSASYHDALKAIIAKINARKVDLEVRHLLIVPERYTLLAERYLYENSNGSFDAEVLSLSRLFYKMKIKTPLLSREGAIMLIRGMLPSLELKCYYRSAMFRGFCEKLYDAINDFAANGIEPEDIPDSSLKLCDLKAVYAEYKKRIDGRFVDSMGKLSLIARDAQTSEYLDKVHIYVANFDYVDKATRNVFDALCDRALSFTECVISGDEEVSGKKEKYCGEGALAVKEAAKRIRSFAYGGTPYEDMAVIMGNASTAQVKRIFEEFELPCFLAESKRLSDFPLSSFLMTLFECAEKKSRESFIVLSKNIYMGIEKRHADEFENYVNSRLIDYKGFYEEFSDSETEVEQVRKKLVRTVSRVEKEIKEVSDARSFGQVIEDVLQSVSAESITSEAFGSVAIIEKIRALISLMEQVSISGNFEFISAVFAEGLKATEMSSIPYEGGVIVGDPASFRGGKYKFVAVLGFDDGFLPQIYDDSSLISDDEKEFFSQMERAAAINMRYERELSAVLASAENIFATYSSPSGMMDELFEDAVEADEENYVLRAGCKKHAVELMLELTRKAEVSAGDERAFINALFKATRSDDTIFLSPRVDVIDNAEKLFFPYGTTSVTQLQRYFKCPYRHFADYGLRLKDRDKGEISAVDIGSFLHLIVERIVKSGDFSDIEHSVVRIVDEIVAEGGKFALANNRSELEALRTEAIETIKIYVDHLKKGKFKPIGQEIEFKYDLGGVDLVGKIDMADEYDGYIRLVDYKTGDYELKFSDVYYGMNIQLPMYMAACGKKYRQAAMFNFPFVYNWIHDRFDHRFSGFMLSDDAIVKATDGGFEDESEVFNLKRKSNGTLYASDYLLTEDEMHILTDYAVKVGKNAVKEIREGYAAASPCGEKECKFCSYACLCTGKIVRKKAKMRKSGFYRGCNDENLV